VRACCGENMVKHYASDEEIDRARQLRRASTEVETRLWQHLRARQMAGHKFRRQHMVLRFWNNEVMENIDGVLRVIADALTRKT
jgi:very-short-patch-repair endonuclease